MSSLLDTIISDVKFPEHNRQHSFPCLLLDDSYTQLFNCFGLSMQKCTATAMFYIMIGLILLGKEWCTQKILPHIHVFPFTHAVALLMVIIAVVSIYCHTQ